MKQLRRIQVEEVKPPVPSRRYDYRAMFEGDDDGEQHPTGYGETPQAAILDLLDTADHEEWYE